MESPYGTGWVTPSGDHLNRRLSNERISNTATGTGAGCQFRDKGADTILYSRLKRYQRLSKQIEAWLGGKMLNDVLLANSPINEVIGHLR